MAKNSEKFKLVRSKTQLNSVLFFGTTFMAQYRPRPVTGRGVVSPVRRHSVYNEADRVEGDQSEHEGEEGKAGVISQTTHVQHFFFVCRLNRVFKTQIRLGQISYFCDKSCN